MSQKLKSPLGDLGVKLREKANLWDESETKVPPGGFRGETQAKNEPVWLIQTLKSPLGDLGVKLRQKTNLWDESETKVPPGGFRGETQ